MGHGHWVPVARIRSPDGLIASANAAEKLVLSVYCRLVVLFAYLKLAQFLFNFQIWVLRPPPPVDHHHGRIYEIIELVDAGSVCSTL